MAREIDDRQTDKYQHICSRVKNKASMKHSTSIYIFYTIIIIFFSILDYLKFNLTEYINLRLCKLSLTVRAKKKKEQSSTDTLKLSIIRTQTGNLIETFSHQVRISVRFAHMSNIRSNSNCFLSLPA